MSRLRWVFLLAAGVLAGCDRSDSAASEPVAVTEGTPSEGSAAGGDAEVAPAQRADGAAPVDAPADAGTANVLAPSDLKVGVARDELVRALGECGERVKFLEPRSYRRALEVFQPREGECVERFGARHFIVVGDQVERVEEGLRAKVTARPVERNEESAPLRLPN